MRFDITIVLTIDSASKWEHDFGPLSTSLETFTMKPGGAGSSGFVQIIEQSSNHHSMFVKHPKQGIARDPKQIAPQAVAKVLIEILKLESKLLVHIY